MQASVQHVKVYEKNNMGYGATDEEELGNPEYTVGDMEHVKRGLSKLSQSTTRIKVPNAILGPRHGSPGREFREEELPEQNRAEESSSRDDRISIEMNIWPTP
ncbi:unnamed protein product [Haemonchus placei]|uniref:Miff domain-containing protein n=1 Tax=Haemonchus placei TaxID=6290 RepID=A0A0N4WB22_HAEPC|nr:unnamed protein product [Haemonchus placei]